MANISHSKEDVLEMLSKMHLDNVDDLFKIIPEKFKYDYNELIIGDSLSEQELESHMSKIGKPNINANNSTCFMGGGSYDHYIPKIVDTLSSRSEFYTAYTPYQPEVSQGTLQYLYEFQSMICNLSGMEIANASLYDCASSIAEACSLAVSVTRKKKILISKLLHPSYIDVIKTYFSGKEISIDFIDIDKTGCTSMQDLKNSHNDDVAALVIQTPNYYGLVENLENLSTIKKNSLLICVSDPIAMSILKKPCESGADVYVGEGQPLGNYMSYGGPYIGLFATKLKYARKMPGRIIGKTVDMKGEDGFVMTLQTREQHIRRDKATSNICTNQGLLALRCTIYLALMGNSGLPAIAKLCYNNSHYAAIKINEMPNYSIYKDNFSFIKEFIVETKVSAKLIQKDAMSHNLMIDCPINDNTDTLLLLAFTEKRTKDEIDNLLTFLSKYK